MNILINLCKNAPRWRSFLIAASIFTIFGFLARRGTPPPMPIPMPIPSQKCLPPNNLEGSYKNGSDPSDPIIILQWSLVGSNAQQHTLQRKKTSESDYQDIIQVTGQTSRYEEHVAFGSDYNYRIITFCGNDKVFSNPIIVDMTPSYKITEFNVQGDKDKLSVVNLKWDGIGDRNLTGFLVRRKNARDNPQWQDIETMSVSEAIRIYTDRDDALKPGTEYCYQVVPKLIDGIEGGASNIQCYVMPLPAPKNLKAQRTAQSVTLTWEWPDNSLKQDVDRFVIYRWNYSIKKKPDAKIETPPQKEYEDKEANDQRASYLYKVKAVDKQSREGFEAEIQVE